MEQLKIGDRVVLLIDYDFAKKGSYGTIKEVCIDGIDVLFDKGHSLDDNYLWFIYNKSGYKKIECNQEEPDSFETQIKQVATHLLQKPITSWEAINNYRITRLSAVIHELRKNNTITSVWEDNGKVGKEKKRWTKYTLIK